MIQFPCKCGYAFEVPQDQAGGLVQCPNCHLLADIPTLSDLSNINADGTFAFESTFTHPDAMTAADLHRVFTNKTVDSEGREKDLRTRGGEQGAIGLASQEPTRVAPRYDPETGELIRPLQLKDEEPIPVLALGTEIDPAEVDQLDVAYTPAPVLPLADRARKPTSLGYAVGITQGHVTLKTLAIELLMPANATVMFFIFLFYLAGYFSTLAMATYAERFVTIVRPFLLLNLAMWLILSHLGCTIEETGPDAVDELPRPLRNFALSEDLINPLFRVVLAGMICFLPAAGVMHFLDSHNPMTLPMALIFHGIGIFFFPAVVLTTVTGVTVLNLRPDRVAAVITLCGVQYFASIALFTLAAIPTVFYLGNELLFPQQLSAPFFGYIEQPYIMLPAIAMTVYLLHFFAWHLGMMYRAHHEEFPWLAQRFNKPLKA